MILNATKFGGNRTKDVEVGPDRRTDRPIPIYPTQTMFAGGINVYCIVYSLYCDAKLKLHTVIV